VVKKELSINPELHRLLELAGLFLRLGATAFGGPAAHIAMMEDEVVRRRRWLTHEEFLDLLGATNLIPGPNSTELAIHIGHRRAGWAGLVIAGCCFILPAMLIVGIISWAYVRFGELPQAEGLLYGVKPVIIAVIAQALLGLGRTAVKNTGLGLIGVIGAGLNFFGINELAVLFGTGLLVASVRAVKVWRSTVFASRPPLLGVMPSFPFLSSSAGVAGIAAASMPFNLWTLFLFFTKVGSVLFGSGYVLLAFLHADLVERWHWLTEAQLMDAIAVGQFTPGPVFTTATFIGYVLAGTAGAVVATAGIFLPAFFFVAISGPFVPRLRKSAIAGAFLDGVNVASLALMAVVTWRLSATTLVDGFTGVLALWLILAGAGLGFLPVLLRT
jgi:chromate transporter